VLFNSILEEEEVQEAALELQQEGITAGIETFELDWIVTNDLNGIACLVMSFLPLAVPDRPQ